MHMVHHLRTIGFLHDLSLLRELNQYFLSSRFRNRILQVRAYIGYNDVVNIGLAVRVHSRNGIMNVLAGAVRSVGLQKLA
jgi:hypothetical protein